MDVCKTRQVGEYATFCTVLTAYAESDFNPDARQKNSEGVFQQTPPWWKNDRIDVRSATNAFLDDFLSNEWQHVNTPVIDCWITQRWDAPDPQKDRNGFDNAAETKNYYDRIGRTAQIISTGKVV